MRKNGLNARNRRKFMPNVNSNHWLPICGNVLNRGFRAEKPGIDWVFSSDMETVHAAIPAVEPAFA
jgi:transposase InsO family protein